MSALSLADVAFLGAAAGVGELYPVGAIVMWGSASLPDGWVVCDGGSGTPDLRGLFVVSSGSSYAVGDTGGAASVTLTAAQLPSHSHALSGYSVSTSGSHAHTYTRINGAFFGGSGGSTSVRGGPFAQDTFSSGNHSHSVSGTTGAIGSGNSHENRPAYYSLYYMMRVA